MATAQELMDRGPLTFEDVREFDPDEYPGELERGEWIPLTRPGMGHGKVMARIAAVLDRYLEEHPVGEVVCGDAGAMLEYAPDTLRGPDVAFVANERLPPEGLTPGWWEGSPDLVVEIISPSQTFRGTASRVREYLLAGARLVWIAEPKTRSVTVYTPDGSAHTLGPDEEIDGGDLLPGFRCRVAELFSRPRRS